jgi:uncharacterized protein YecE (DUF72 family)
MANSVNEPCEVPLAQAERLRPRLKALAKKGVYFGSSSWKYDGWLNSIYSAPRYDTRGKFSKKKFDDTCLTEYAETFPTVCGDFSFYQFYSADYWKRLFDATPVEFLFAFKVTEDITVPKWPKHARYGAKGGSENKSFLDAETFTSRFAKPLLPYQERISTLIFEFGTFAKAVFPKPEDFFARLAPFLGALPQGFRYSIEIRNQDYLGDDYFSLLAEENVAHVFNAWTRMPELSRQIEMSGAFTADFSVTRALLARFHNHDQAVDTFEPYDRVQQVSDEARGALTKIASRALTSKNSAFVYVNNRLEGNAPGTIEAVTDGLKIPR